MTTTIAPSATMYGPAGDEGGFCHVWRDGRTVCGAPLAADSPGLHAGRTVGGRCSGCGRPRCPDCEVAG